nr:MAG TPA: hypothetical protein [Caudoviricetes sp.]
MSWKRLSTDYKDISWSGLKKYTQIDNDDGTVSFRDDTKYTNKESSFFGAKDANQINEAVNYIMTKLENGTDLYSVFQEFFDSQKELFIEEKNGKMSDINSYVSDLKSRGETALTNVESNHRQRMGEYEDLQKNEFNSWFTQMKDHLSSDQAGKLQLQIEDLKVLLDGFASKETVFSDDGNTITEKMGNKKLVTEFVSDSVITKKLYVSDVLKLTKITTFSEDGKSIREVIA